jgi:hypothetical protein
MSELRPIIIGIILTGLLAVALINGGILLSLRNNNNNTIANDPSLLSYSNTLQTNLDETFNNTNSSFDKIGSSPITLTTGNIIFDAIGGVWRTLTVMPLAIFKLTTNLISSKILGGSFNVVIGVVLSLLVITIIFGIWKWVSTGEGG